MTQADRILALLRTRPRTNTELNRVAFRYSARLHELRRDGYIINTERVKEGVFRYSLGEDE